MSLGLEADRQRDIHEGNFGLLEQFFGALDPPLQQIFMGPHADRRPELRGKVHPAQSGDRGEVLQCDLRSQMIIDILQDALEAPFLQRPHIPAGMVLGGSGVGSRGISLLAELPGQDGEAEGVGTDRRVGIMRGFRCRKCVGKAPNDGVFEIF